MARKGPIRNRYINIYIYLYMTVDFRNIIIWPSVN